jgi:hypothetical protein
MNVPSEKFSKDYTDCYVAFLDILGFKRIASVNSHEHLKSVYRNFSETIFHSLSNGKYVLWSDGKTESLGPDIRRATVNSLLVSDSIVIWTDDNTAAAFCDIVRAVRSLLAFSMIDGIPLRGAISVGALTSVLNQWPTKNHNFQHSLFGKAIVDAAEAEKNQEWSGCEITKDAIASYQCICGEGESIVKSGLILIYPVPRKEGEMETGGYVINWANHPQAGIDSNTVTDAFAPPFNPNAVEWEKFKKDEWPKIERKLKNTLKFFQHVKSSSLASSV